MTRNTENSATKLIRESLGRPDLDQNTICPTLLHEMYRSATPCYGTPDLSFARRVLALNSQSPDELNTPFYGVIVETRKHRALEQVVSTVVNTLGIPIQLFHGNTNKEFIMQSGIATHVNSGAVALTPMNTEKLNARYYNSLLLSADFWQAVRGRNKVLIFQTDSICCSNSPYTLADFSQFDYIGSSWKRKRPSGLNIDGGCGGFSLRDWQETVRCLSHYSPTYWPGGEDGYFAFHMQLMGGRVASNEEASRFSSQCSFKARSLGAHRVTEMSRHDRNAFLDYCPEAIAMLPLYRQIFINWRSRNKTKRF
jgi:hypothetical protein